MNPSHAEEVIEIPQFQSGIAGNMYRYKTYWFNTPHFPFEKHFQEVKSFPLNPDDVLVVSFPKSGTTWVQAIVWLIMSDAVDEELFPATNLGVFFPFIDLPFGPGLRLADLAKQPSPRLLKSHFPYEFLPADIHKAGAKVIYIARNPKDVCVSYYHFHRMLDAFKYRGPFGDFVDLFAKGTVAYGPWHNHVLEYWQHRNDSNVLFVTYEDLHTDVVETVRKIALFLGRSLTEDRLLKIISVTRLEEMRTNKSLNYSWYEDSGKVDKSEGKFLRKGIIGDWQNYFSEDKEKLIEASCNVPVKLQGLTFTDTVD